MSTASLGHPTSGASRRLWPRVVEVPAPDHCAELGPCLVWTGQRHPAGHGKLRVGGRTHYAHRLAWVLCRGPVPPGLCVLHRCDVPACCNPAHLFLGTVVDNNADRDAKGRTFRKLSAADVDEILRRYAAGGDTQDGLAAAFDVVQPRISQLVRSTLGSGRRVPTSREPMPGRTPAGARSPGRAAEGGLGEVTARRRSIGVPA